MKIALHAGHNPDGKIGCGAVGYMKESTAAREIVSLLFPLLDARNNICTDITVNNGTSSADVLQELAYSMNNKDFDLGISIHLNSSTNQSANGVECYHWSTNDDTKKLSGTICSHLEKLGYRNRGAKANDTLYILRKVSCPVVLIECGFVSNQDDCQRFDAGKIARSIYDALSEHFSWNQTFPEYAPDDAPLYRVQVGAFSKKENAINLKLKLKEQGFEAFITT